MFEAGYIAICFTTRARKLPCKKNGVLMENFEKKKKNLKRYQDPVLWEWLEFFFTSMRCQF